MAAQDLMPNPILPVPLRVGEILDRSIRLVIKLTPNLLPVWLFTAILAVLQNLNSKDLVVNLSLMLISFVAGMFMYGYVTFLASDAWLNQPINPRSALGRVRFGLVMRVILLSLFIGVAGGLLLLLLIIPGLVYFINRILAPIIAYLEDATIDRAIERSKFLMTQKKWYSLDGPWTRISGLWLVTFIVSLVIGAVMGAGGFVAALNGGIKNFASSMPFLTILFFGTLLNSAVYSFSSIAMIGFYYDLRARYEGMDIMSSLTNTPIG